MVAANALDGVARDKRITLSPSLSWASGIASVNQQSPLGLNTRFDRAASPEAPFATLSFGLKVDDQDGGNTLLANPNMNTAVAGTCSGSGCNAVLLGTQKLLYGRLQVGTAAGLASAPLAIPLQMQYYEAGNWLQNKEDNKEDKCTQLSLANQGFTFLNPSHTFDAATRELNLGRVARSSWGWVVLHRVGMLHWRKTERSCSTLPSRTSRCAFPTRSIWQNSHHRHSGCLTQRVPMTATCKARPFSAPAGVMTELFIGAKYCIE